jgi:hypothetical protein
MPCSMLTNNRRMRTMYAIRVFPTAVLGHLLLSACAESLARLAVNHQRQAHVAVFKFEKMSNFMAA